MSKYDVFVSYAREDRASAERLIEALRESGCTLWWDDNIPTGSKFDAILDQALSDAACVLVLWSPDAITSEWVKMEAQFGLARDALVPVFVAPVDLPQPFHRLQTADLTNWTAGDIDDPTFQRVIADIESIVGRASVDAAGQPVDGFDEKHAIAVLPFEERSVGAEPSYLGESIAEDLIRSLQAFKTLPVIARHSSFAFDRDRPDLKRIARELGVGYIVSGSVRTTGDRVRVAVELIDGVDQHLVWSENFERQVVDIFDLEDQISVELASRIEPEITRAERLRVLPSHPDTLSTWQLLRRAQHHQFMLTLEDAAIAREMVEKALASEPDSVDALCVMGWQEFWDVSARHGVGDDWDGLAKIARRALSVDPEDSGALELLGIASMLGGAPFEARSIFAQAVQSNPCNASALSNLGSTYILTGQPELGIEPIERALRLSPVDLFAFHARGELAHCYFLMGEWGKAIAEANKSLRIRKKYWLAQVIRIAAMARGGRIADASVALEELLEHRDDLSMRHIRYINYQDPERFEYLAESLELAGWVRPRM